MDEVRKTTNLRKTLPMHYISGLSCDIIWHGRGFEQSLYNKAGIYGVNKLPGMVTLTTKVKKIIEMISVGSEIFSKQVLV